MHEKKVFFHSKKNRIFAYNPLVVVFTTPSPKKTGRVPYQALFGVGSVHYHPVSKYCAVKGTAQNRSPQPVTFYDFVCMVALHT